MSKTVIVETSGIVCVLAKQREIRLTIRESATWEDVIAALAQAAPGLVGDVITKDRRHLVSDNLLNVGGRVTIRDLSAVADVPEGEKLVFLTDAC